MKLKYQDSLAIDYIRFTLSLLNLIKLWENLKVKNDQINYFRKILQR